MSSSPEFVTQLVLLTFAGLLLWAAYRDFSSYKIPNRIVAAIAALYPAYAIAAYPKVDWVGGLTTGGVMLGICFLLYVKRWTGAGDAKFIAAVGLWAGPGLTIPFIFAMTLVGGLLSLLVMIRRYFGTLAVDRGSLLTRLLPVLSVQIPYGVAISAGGLFVAAQLLRP